jgi:hypothetical protein
MPPLPFKKPEVKPIEEGPPTGYEINGDWLKVEKYQSKWNQPRVSRWGPPIFDADGAPLTKNMTS